MTASNWIRQIHRWTAVVFTAAVIVVTIALARKTTVVWVSYIPLPPLFLLLLTGLYLFVLPYAVKWRGARAAAHPARDGPTA